MKNKKTFIVWCISIIVIVVIVAANTVINIFDISLPDVVIRILGIMQMIALPIFPILVFVMGKRFWEKNPDEAEQK